MKKVFTGLCSLLMAVLLMATQPACVIVERVEQKNGVQESKSNIAKQDVVSEDLTKMFPGDYRIDLSDLSEEEMWRIGKTQLDDDQSEIISKFIKKSPGTIKSVRESFYEVLTLTFVAGDSAAKGKLVVTSDPEKNRAYIINMQRVLGDALAGLSVLEAAEIYNASEAFLREKIASAGCSSWSDYVKKEIESTITLYQSVPVESFDPGGLFSKQDDGTYAATLRYEYKEPDLLIIYDGSSSKEVNVRFDGNVIKLLGSISTTEDFEMPVELLEGMKLVKIK